MPTAAQPASVEVPAKAASAPLAGERPSATTTPAPQAEQTTLTGASQAHNAQPVAAPSTAATTATQDPSTSPSTQSSPSTPPATVPPDASQAEPAASPPANASTTSSGAAATQPEPGEVGSSPNTSIDHTLTAASTQPAIPPNIPAAATSTRSTTARPSAPAATPLTSATDSTQASTVDTAVQPFNAVSVGEQTATAGTTSSTPTLASGVGMQDIIESIRATIEVAARQGITQARIALQPAELGEIRIHLSQTSDGLLARVTADTPAAAQVLAAGRAELHHSLSSLGLSLLRLDIGSSGQSDVGGREGRFPGRSDASASSSSSQRQDGENDSELVAGIESAPSPTGPARGELVDVLA